MSAPQTEIHVEGEENLVPVETVCEFGIYAFVENIAVRLSRQILVTISNRNQLLQVDPRSKTGPILVHQFEQNVSGIVEVEKDTFYVSSGTIGQKGSFAIFKVDLSKSSDGTGAIVSKFVDVPEALFLNGSTLLSSSDGLVLTADSILGAVFAADTKNATVRVWLQHKALEKTSADPNFPGVNGIKMHDGALYLSNTEAGTYLRAAITESGDAVGVVEQLYNKCVIDDFVVDTEGTAYLTSHVFNSVYTISKSGVRTRIAGGPKDSIVAGTTAAAFGRTVLDKDTLYVTTNGGISMPVDGNVGSGRLLALQIKHLGSS